MDKSYTSPGEEIVSKGIKLKKKKKKERNRENILKESMSVRMCDL